jgi:hypothetical protein
MMLMRISAAPARPRPLRFLLGTGLAAVALIVVLALAGSANAAARHKPKPRIPHVPNGFVGMDIDGPLFDPTSPLDFGNQMTSMVADGVQTVRGRCPG